ncbi:uncharacterized protein N7443_005556 [Penicillium atrosanguineum]|uniref:uncharacterized protein n=1 Tax=Penicillium atrosanguineum TaxID=1132637 RepID=UPI0023858E36|nr:uncharacterized protein N7443_005556 [Penicillium atrosanguineum]KAJ5300554.1 hypothetical protein N7443_005556 [Penicillium atrosanguineum]
MMAVGSPLSILSYQDTSSPYAGSDHMSLEGSPFPSARNSGYLTSHSDPMGATDTLTSSKQHDAETENKPATLIRGTGVSQSGLTIQTGCTHQVGITNRSDEDEPPQSVIHAPPGFGDFSCQEGPERYFKPPNPPTHQIWNMRGVGTKSVDVAKVGNSPISPPPLTTNVTPAKDWSERATPRAQTRHDFEESERLMRSSSLEGTFGNKAIEINALRAALTECWTLCNTLASLSYINRERVFRSHEDDIQEDAWRSCWRLCQKLYDTRDHDYTSQVNPTLDLCRDFCQALFEVRVCDNDLADSVLRVSFELNNHLFNTHDRNLPDAFRERTLDFYITLCHRLMKQRTRLTETDSLLSACWTLAEMLFSMRQSKREGKFLDEEILGSAVQACWELCDIFREGWTLHSMRYSDRGTPRPSQTTFAQAFQQATQQSELDFADNALGQVGNPETPTTIFEDTATVSPDEAPAPNILVLGHGDGHASHSSHTKWPSSESSISEKSRSSGQTASSANTVTTMSEDPNFTRLKVLITKAAIDSGYQRGGPQNMPSFVKSLPSDAFGLIPWQTSLLKNYQKLVSFDPAFRNAGFQARVSAIEVAHACQAMVQSGQYSWLRDLYRLVFGFHVEEAMGRKGVIIQT